MTGKRITITICCLIIAACIGYTFFGEELIVKLFGPKVVEAKEGYASSGTATFDHSRLGEILSRHVRDNGDVDYEGVRDDEARLADYIDQLGSVHFAALSRNEKLALMINAYNAFTLKLMVEYLPKTSIKQIPEAKRWEDRRWVIGGRPFSLKELEDDELRSKFIEPRIHFAINCASRSCPPLRNEPYTGAKLELQLRDQAKRFHASAQGCEVVDDGETVRLSRLYLWYGKDFGPDEKAVLEYAAQWSPPLKEAMTDGAVPDIDWIDYDWSINEVRN